MSATRSRLVSLIAPFALLFPLAHAQAQNPPSALTDRQLLSQLDADMAKVVILYDSIKGTPAIALTPQDARLQFSPQDAAKLISRSFGAPTAPTKVGKVTDGLTVDGRGGNKIPIRIYAPAGTGPFPVIVYYHGGGFVIATIDTYDESARALSNDANAIVVSVEYRKAPEAPYPAALNDAVDAYKWVASAIGMYDGLPTKVAVAGESAGGNLATEVAIAARDQGFQAPTHQLLIYPVTGSNTAQISDDLFTSPELPLNLALLKYFFQYYVPNPSEANDPGVAPINADLHNLAPATILSAEEDPLLSDGVAYYLKLLASGNPAAYQLYTGTTHEFFGMGAVVAKAKTAEGYGAARISASFK